MDRVRAAVLAGCVLLLGLAGALVTVPSALGPLAPPLQAAIESLIGNTGLALAAIGLATAITSAVIANSSSTAAPARPDLEAILGGLHSTTAGAALDDQVDQLTATGIGGDRDELEAALREAVRATAVTVLGQAQGLSPAAARAQLEDGEWTMDAQAAAFFAPLPPPLLVRLREWFSARSGLEQRLERVMSELESRLDLDGHGLHGDDGSIVDHRGPGGIGAPDELETAVEHRLGAEAGGPDDRVEETVQVPTATNADRRVLGVSRRFGFGVGLAAVAVGLVTSVTAPFLLGLLAVSHSLVKYLTRVPASEVELTRVVATDKPVPGDLVEVELAVENVGERPLLDLRVVDGVPGPLRVVGGSPSMATSLQPGQSDDVTYRLQAKRGTFTFGETELIVRDLANVNEHAVGVTVPTRLTGATRLDDLALQEQASRRIGTVKTDRGGSGVEFYGTREYRPGDPMSRVNWNQLAKTGELTTVEFREQRAPTVSIILDQREAARVAPATAALDGVDLSVYAAEQAFLTLLDAGTEVGLITYGERLTDVEPASDEAQRALVQSRLRAATDRYAAALGEADVDATGAVFQRLDPEPASIQHHVPANAQVILLSPATDDFALAVTERLAAFGHPVTLLSPSVASTGSVGARKQRLDRACRLRTIRDQGARVIDWSPDEPVQMAITRATASGGNP